MGTALLYVLLAIAIPVGFILIQFIPLWIAVIIIIVVVIVYSAVKMFT